MRATLPLHFSALLLALLLVRHGALGAQHDPPAPPPTPVVREAIEGALRATVRLDRAAIKTGEPIELLLSAEGPVGVRIELPDLPATFEVLDARAAEFGRDEPGENSARVSVRRRLVVTSYESGSIELPVLTFRFIDDDGATQELSTEPVTIEVTSRLADPFDPASFEDVKPAVELPPVPLSWKSLLWIGLIAANAIAIIIALYRMLRLWKESRTALPLTPEQWAEAELERLVVEGLPSRGMVEPFFVRLTGILRDYLERRLAIAAPEQTTDEFLRAATRHAALGASRRPLLERLLRHSDLVKFARGSAAIDECDAAVRTVREVVAHAAPPPGHVEPPR